MPGRAGRYVGECGSDRIPERLDARPHGVRAAHAGCCMGQEPMHGTWFTSEGEVVRGANPRDNACWTFLQRRGADLPLAPRQPVLRIVEPTNDARVHCSTFLVLHADSIRTACRSISLILGASPRDGVAYASSRVEQGRVQPFSPQKSSFHTSGCTCTCMRVSRACVSQRQLRSCMF